MRTPRPQLLGTGRATRTIFDLIPRAGDRRGECRAAFREFLSKHAPLETFMGKESIPARQAVSLMYSRLQLRLGANFLGITLGGPLVHGMGLDLVSELDCRVHIQAEDEELTATLTREVEGFLKGKQFVPCKYPVCDLAQRPFNNLVAALSVFADQIILPADGPGLKHAALRAFESVIERAEARHKPQLLAVLKERFDRLTASDPAYVADKFVRGWEPVLTATIKAPTLRNDKAFMTELIRLARQPMEQRAAAFPFPRQIAALFGRL